MAVHQPSFEWDETPDSVTVRFPVPAVERAPVGCLAAFVAVIAIVAVPAMIVFVWKIIAAPTDVRAWLGYGIGSIIIACTLLYAVHMFRQARLPPTAVEPSVLSIANGILKIERGGRDRDMDYSWQLPEIADLRICAAAPDRAYFTPNVLLAQALAPNELIRISIEHPTGEVDDVFVIAPAGNWTDRLETRLRTQLGLSGYSRADVA